MDRVRLYSSAMLMFMLMLMLMPVMILPVEDVPFTGA
jgi:hypothetical protein